MKRKAIYYFWAGDNGEHNGLGTLHGVEIKILAEDETEARELAKKFAKRDFYCLQKVEN